MTDDVCCVIADGLCWDVFMAAEPVNILKIGYPQKVQSVPMAMLMDRLCGGTGEWNHKEIRQFMPEYFKERGHFTVFLGANGIPERFSKYFDVWKTEYPPLEEEELWTATPAIIRDLDSIVKLHKDRPIFAIIRLLDVHDLYYDDERHKPTQPALEKDRQILAMKFIDNIFPNFISIFKRTERSTDFIFTSDCDKVDVPLVKGRISDWNRHHVVPDPTAIIFAASDYIHHGFNDRKPKCLFHHKGEVLLERQIRFLRDEGISDIRILVGYRKKMIQDFVRKRGFKVKYICNLNWGDTLTSLEKCLSDAEKDVLIIYGDTWFTKKALRAMIESPWPITTGYDGTNSLTSPAGGRHMHKIRREKTKFILNLMRTEKYTDKYGGLMPFIYCLEENRCQAIIDSNYRDFDHFIDTDEGIAFYEELIPKIRKWTKGRKVSAILIPVREESMNFLHKHGENIGGTVLNCGSSNDRFNYRRFFPNCSRYSTMDIKSMSVNLIGDIQNIPQVDNSEDCIVAYFVLTIIPDIEKALSEFRRVLKPNGTLFATFNGMAYMGRRFKGWDSGEIRGLLDKFFDIDYAMAYDEQRVLMMTFVKASVRN